jgi:hypothetical protein
MPMLISTCAVVRIGTAIATAKKIVPRINFFMFCLPGAQTQFISRLATRFHNSESYSVFVESAHSLPYLQEGRLKKARVPRQV